MSWRCRLRCCSGTRQRGDDRNVLRSSATAAMQPLRRDCYWSFSECRYRKGRGLRAQDARFVVRVTARRYLPLRPASSTRSAMAAERIQDAVATYDSGPIFDWLQSLIQLAGDLGRDRVRLRRTTCLQVPKGRAAPVRCRTIYRTALLPAHPLRKGGLNQAAYSLFLFISDV